MLQHTYTYSFTLLRLIVYCPQFRDPDPLLAATKAEQSSSGDSRLLLLFSRFSASHQTRNSRIHEIEGVEQSWNFRISNRKKL